MVKNSVSIVLLGFLMLGSFSCGTSREEESAALRLNLPEEKEKISSVLHNTKSTYESILSALDPFKRSLTKTKDINQFSFVAEYQPHLLLAVVNTGSFNALDRLDKKSLNAVGDYENLHYIKFSMENKDFHSELIRYDLKSAQEYSDRIMYYSFYSNRDAYLIENGCDTIRNAFVHFERTFDVSPKLNMTFVFEKKSRHDLNKVSFVFEDVIFNHGRLNFEFDGKTISLLNATEIKKLML